MTEMTKREFFEAVIANVENEDLVLFAEKEIEKMNERNAKRKNTPSKTAIANEPRHTSLNSLPIAKAHTSQAKSPTQLKSQRRKQVLFADSW